MRKPLSITLKWLHYLTAALLFLLAVSSTGDAQHAPAEASVKLTPEERAYLAEHPVLKMGVGVAFPPFQFVENEKGGPAYKGVAAETVKLLEQRLGVRMEPVWNITFAEALEMGRSGAIDAFPCLSWTTERSEYLSFTSAYLSYPLVIVSREDAPFIGSVDDLNGRKVAEVQALSTYSKLQNELPHLKLDYVFTKDTQAMLEAVSFGKAEACIVDLAVASYVINNRGLTNLKVAAPTRWRENPLAMAVPKGREILRDILQKGLDSITHEEMDAMQQHWLGLRYSSLVNPVLVRRILLQGGGAAVLVVTIILLWNRRLRKEIAERKRAEETLKASEHRFHLFMEYLPAAVFIKSQDDRLVFANTFLKNLFGWDDFCGKTTAELIPSDIAQTMTQQDKQAIAEGYLCLEESFTDPKGQPRVFTTHKFAIPVAGGDTLLGGIAIDITERKRMEELMVQAEKMMSVGGLAAGLAHEINNPLGGIIQGSQVVLKRLTDDTGPNRNAALHAGCDLEAVHRFVKERQVIAIIESLRDSAIRAAKIVQDMLTFSRQSTPATVIPDISDLLEQAVELCQNDFDLKGKYDFRHIHIIRDYQPDMGPIRCSRSMLQQVLVNILRNAAQALETQAKDAPAPEIALRTKQQNGHAVIEIEDNGPGMDEPTRKNVFEPFFTTKPPGSGTGLGLSVSYFIITTIHKGSIEVVSSPGNGTTFIITLPVAPHTEDKTASIA